LRTKSSLVSITAIAFAGIVALGCSGASNSDLPPDKDKELRNNFSRALTPEEVAKMNGGGPAKKDATSGVQPPTKK